MPSYTSFEYTKSLRDDLLRRTLDPVYGNYVSPKRFTRDNYQVQTQNDYSNIDLPPVDSNRSTELSKPKSLNTFKPTEYNIFENLSNLQRRANLQLYPYFTKTNDGLIGILTTKSYDNESELFKFAARHIKSEKTGPLLSRIEQNLYTSTVAKVRIADALQGNTTTLVNILKGKEPLIEGNNKITVAKSLPGKAIDFAQTVAGLQLPFTEIPGDYLSNPRNPVNVRPTQTTLATKVWQDVTGVLGSIVGIDRRPLPSRKPSDLMIEYMGSASKNRLFDLLAYSKYAPNYTTLARSQQSTKIFDIPNAFAQGIKTLLGTEAPNGLAYIGDDRGNDVKNATTDLFSGRKIKSNYYQTILFDPELSKLTRQTSLSEKGSIPGNLTWIGKKSENKLNLYSNSTNEEQTKLNESLSKIFKFRTDSILETTQQILETQPKGGEGKSHIANVIDQTSRFFKEGDIMISKGSAVKYVANGKDIGVEYARVWTKDRPYYKMADTMPFYKETESTPYYKKTERPYRRTNVRRFDGSVMSDTWNLNIAPMSNGKKDFSSSSNIFKIEGSQEFYAKKYMLSIENLAWKTSNKEFFTVNDLPFCERGPNGGRVMWFPPYDLKVSEQNNATWDKNVFLGRPEPIYTYQGTERNGQLSFKIIVDHPSILNLLIREHFKNMTDEQADDYINAYFSGAKDIDFYSLIRTYTTLDSSDIQLVQRYLASANKEENLKKAQQLKQQQVKDDPSSVENPEGKDETIKKDFVLNFIKNVPLGSDEKYNGDYSEIAGQFNALENLYIDELTDNLTELIAGDKPEDAQDMLIIYGKEKLETSEITQATTNVLDKVTEVFQNINTQINDLDSVLSDIKDNLDKRSLKEIIVNINSFTSDLSDEDASYKLSLRRSHSIIKYILKKISNSDSSTIDQEWTNFEDNSVIARGQQIIKDIIVPFNKLGYVNVDGSFVIKTVSHGPKLQNDYDQDCHQKTFNNTKLRQYTPKSFGCRRSAVKVEYTKIVKKETPPASNTTIVIEPTTDTTKPPIDVMKRIVMKTLTECYYFKMLEETSPVQFNTLREKLKYFHPGFHSMTPEGLNARLTFLNQCLRPGDTIPVKGLAETSDINARNTSFGPPPICVLRVGDFYHSKIIIRDVNITFDDGVWDLNADGIGVQPMIASVSLQINFIGGHGLERPIERLQNALSSNFYANTEMYDERSISTATKIGGKDAEEFTKEFLTELNNDYISKQKLKDSNGNTFVEGKYFGTLSGSTLDYTTMIDELFTNTEEYFNSYEKTHEIILEKYGSDVGRLLLHPDYRTTKTLDVENGSTGTSVELFGITSNNFSIPSTLDSLRLKFISEIFTNENLATLMTLNEVIPSDKLQNVDDVLYQEYNFDQKFSDILLGVFSDFESTIKDVEKNRNKIIKTIDELNYVVKNSFDVKFQDNNSTKAVLSAFTPSDFYKNYDNCIEEIKKNAPKFYSKIDSTLDFKNLSSITNDQKSIIIAQLTSKLEEEIYNILVEKLPLYSIEVSEEMKRQIKRQLNRFYSKNKVKNTNLRIPKLRKRRNDKKISYSVSLQDTITTTDEIKKLFSTQNSVTNKLNYYRVI
jgi:hypothetical protein